MSQRTLPAETEPTTRKGHLVLPVLWKPLQRRMDLHHRRALRYAGSLRKSFRPETVHKLRTNLRRLQAYAELLEHQQIAACFGRGVSWFSPLRALHVFQDYLKKEGAPAKARRRFQRAIRKEERKLCSKKRLKKVKALLSETPAAKLERSNIFLRDKLETLRHENRTVLQEALEGLSPTPTRKELHRVRLLIKSLRYQQEIAVELRWGNPRTIESLKRLQTVLGDFRDRDEFVRLAKQLELGGRKKIKRDRRRCLKGARRALRRLRPQHAIPSALSPSA